MNDDRRTAAAQIMAHVTRARMVLGKPPLEPVVLREYARLLSSYTPDQVGHAVDAHLSDPERGRWWPTPAEIIAQVEATDPATVDQIPSGAAFDTVMRAIKRRTVDELPADIAHAVDLFGGIDLFRYLDERHWPYQARHFADVLDDVRERQRAHDRAVRALPASSADAPRLAK